MPLSAPLRHGTVPRPLDRHEWGLDSGFVTLASLIKRDVSAVSGTRDELVERVIAQAISSFVIEKGAAQPAATRVAPLLWELGERHVCHGLGSQVLDAGFQHARHAAQRGFQVVDIPRIGEHSLRQHLPSYIELLHHHAIAAWNRGRALLGSEDHRHARLGSVLLSPHQPPPTHRLLRKAGLDPNADYVLLVSVADEMPGAVFDNAAVLAGPHPNEALVPIVEAQRVLARSALRQVVVGPTASLTSVSEAAETVRRCAQLLRAGRAADPRSVVPCVDLLSVLVTDGIPGLSSLLAAKHLAPLEALGHPRRIRDGGLLLQWLVLGQPINQVARSLGIPPQTAHNRLNHLRSLFGATLEDPSQRLELMVALQGALPRWAREG